MRPVRARAAGLVAALAALAAAQSVRAAEPVIRTSSRLGLATSVVFPGGRTVGHPGADGALAELGHYLGIQSVGSELVRTSEVRDALGQVHTTYQQVCDGIPVFSGIVKVHCDASGRVLCINGRFYPVTNKTALVPAVDASVATATAAGRMASDAKPAVAPKLVIVDPGWYGDQATGPRLAWYLILTAGLDEQAFFVDSVTGEVLDQWSVLCSAQVRMVHNAMGTNAIPGPLARAEGDGPVGVVDVDKAYDYLGDTYDFFNLGFGRDGYDDEGSPIVCTVNSTAISCPNAAWSFLLRQMAFCAGSVADDFVAHEFTHGVTQYTANLIYQNQPGQLNESFSDIFGELVDLYNSGSEWAGSSAGTPWTVHPSGPGTDSPNSPRTQACSPESSGYPDGMRWLFGEDAAAFGTAIRDLWQPTCFQDPDRANSVLQTCFALDNGGVHSGSGVLNHAFAMVCDGKTFNGQTVTGIGPVKAAAIWYRALSTYLTVASDFDEAYFAINQAAADLVGTAPNDPRTGLPSASVITAQVAAEVNEALIAVELNTPGACGQSVPVLDSDPPLECADKIIIYEDDFESGQNGWMVANTGPPTAYDWVQRADLPFARPGTAWFCEDANIGNCSGAGESAVHTLFSPPIALPAVVNVPTIVFTHFVETEPRFDGGNVSLRINGGAWQLLPVAAFTYNHHNAALFSTLQGSTNPLANQISFTGVGGQWGTSVVDLRSFVSGGETIEVRFDFAKDNCFGLTGWFVDAFVVYDCASSGDCNATGIADELDIAAGPGPQLLCMQVPNASSGNFSDIDPHPTLGVHRLAENFRLLYPRRIDSIRIWGGYLGDTPVPDIFTVNFRTDANGLPGDLIAGEENVASARELTGRQFANISEWKYTLTLAESIELPAGTYFVEIFNNTVGSPTTFMWERGLFGWLTGVAGFGQGCNPWCLNPDYSLALELYSGVIGTDCDANGLPDECQIAAGSPAPGGPYYCASACDPDCDGDGTPDACGPDFDGDGSIDPCDACPNRRPGDASGDGVVDMTDIDFFVGVLLGEIVDADAVCASDMNVDASADGEDVAGFTSCLLGVGCQ
jgi:Zn-dependent metalloprotease